MRKSNLQSILLGETVKKKMFASGQIFAYSRATPSLLFDSILKEDKNITILSVCPKGVPKPDLKGSEIFNLLFFSLSFYYSIMLTFSSFLFYIPKSEKLILYLPIFYFKIFYFSNRQKRATFLLGINLYSGGVLFPIAQSLVADA